MRADYVIVGAGSAGCAMAYRLSEAGKSVIIIEFGGTDVGPFIQMPAALSYPMNMARYDWGYYSEPEPHLGGRRMATPRGKVIGGSSSINGMIYVRGHALDYEFWSESGASRWSYADVLPYFKRMERWHDGGHGGEKSWRGNSGPLHISRGSRKNPLTKAFVEAGHQAGYPLTLDYNGAQQEGFGPFDATIWNGRRWSAAAAYLQPALKRDNCHLIRGLAEKIVIKNGSAIGVSIQRGKKSENIFANEEVILAASSINSPKILMLSGIGPAKHLSEHGISIVANRPGVGQNLQDHLEMYIQMEAIQPVSLSKYWNFVMKGLISAQWLLTKKGVGASNQFESAAFIRSAAGVKYPDIQYHFLPIAMQYDGSTASDGHSFQAHVGPMRSPSRGSVELNSNNPCEDPKIQFNYMSHEKDWIDFRNCIRLTREIFAQEAFRPFIGKEIQPSADCQSDDELDNFTRNNVESAYHPCGTCKMGAKNDPMSVVDPECSVIGIERLRVADSSIFPRITNGNLNAPSIMTGEKASDHILQRDPLPVENSEPWIHPSWKTDQR